MAAIHFLLPVGFRERLAFDHERFAPWTLLTAAYVHGSSQHLLGNLAGYSVGATVALVICERQDRRRWFWATTVSLLLALPIFVNATSHISFRALGIEPTSRGFSGVVAGFSGFVLVALARHLGDYYGRSTGWRIGSGVFLVLLGEVAVIYTGIPSPLFLTLLVAGFALSFGRLGLRGVQRNWSEDERDQITTDVAITGLVVLLLVVYVRALFPATLVRDGTTTNIVAHGSGFLLGAGIAVGWAWRDRGVRGGRVTD